FAGGFDLDSAEAVCARDGLERSEILSLLGQLVNKSLLLAEEDGEIARYRLLETIRQYGCEQLAASGEAEWLQQRHAAQYLALTKAAEPTLFGPMQIAGFDGLEREHANLRLALRWFASCEDVAGGLQLCNALRRFWSVRGHQVEARGWFTQFLDRQENA